MLGRAATRIELNRDSDLEELAREKMHFEEQRRQQVSHQMPFGQRTVMQPANFPNNNNNHVHSIFTNDSSSSGLGGGQSMLALPNF